MVDSIPRTQSAYHGFRNISAILANSYKFLQIIDNSYKFLQIIHNSYKCLQMFHNIPESVHPLHSFKTSTNAQLNFLMPLSVSASIENKSKTLQNQRSSMLSTKLPRATPGGRMKTRSCRFDPCNRLLANGNNEIRCSPEYFCGQSGEYWKDEYVLLL